MTTSQTTTERLAEAVRQALDGTEWCSLGPPRTRFEQAAVDGLRAALAAHEAQRGQSFMDWFTSAPGGDMNMEHCERAWNAAIASQPSLEREALGALKGLEHAAGFVAVADNSENNDDANRLRTELARARAVLAKAERKG